MPTEESKTAVHTATLKAVIADHCHILQESTYLLQKAAAIISGAATLIPPTDTYSRPQIWHDGAYHFQVRAAALLRTISQEQLSAQMERARLIVRAVNSHVALVEALRDMMNTAADVQMTFDQDDPSEKHEQPCACKFCALNKSFAAAERALALAEEQK